MIADEDLERLLEPLVTQWNHLSARELRALKSMPLADDPSVTVNYVREACFPFGYRFVELAIIKEGVFRLDLRIEGAPGDLSLAAYLPVIWVRGDLDACRSWIGRHCALPSSDEI